MTAIYTPHVSGASSTTFEAENAAEVAEKIMRSNRMRELLGLNGLAGYNLHGLALEKAVSTKDGLTRELVIQWQAMQELPQEQKGEHNPIETKTVYMEHGIDNMPETEWQWVKDGKGKLNAQIRQS
jgi:hypothetical protein